MKAAEHRAEITKLLKPMARRHSMHRVWSDALEVSAISLHNAFDKDPDREARYLQIMEGYEREEVYTFPKILANIVSALEAEISDQLGALFHELELHNEFAGQFFTPYHLSYAMAKMLTGGLGSKIEERGYVTALEPAAGAGGMIIALAQAMKDEGYNPQRQLHVTAVDLDLRCVHMCYIQLTLMHIPAIVVHGDTLRVEEYSQWPTPAHHLGHWKHRIKKEEIVVQAAQATQSEPDNEPEPQEGDGAQRLMFE